MGTNCLTHVLDKEGECICTVYCHWDGYPDGHGHKLYRLFGQTKFGMPPDAKPLEYAADMNCLAAQLVASLKDKPGDVYLMKANADATGEYTYFLSPRSGFLRDGWIGDWLHLRVLGKRDDQIYSGPLAEFATFLARNDL